MASGVARAERGGNDDGDDDSEHRATVTATASMAATLEADAAAAVERLTARIDALRIALRARDDRYEAEMAPGGRSCKAAIDSDPEWRAEYEELKRLEREAAGSPRHGCCAFYVSRKRRFCISRARDGGTMCTLHKPFEGVDAVTPSVVEAVLEREAWRRVVVTPADDGSNGAASASSSNSAARRRKTNVNRRMKKMTNPLAVQFQTPKVLNDAYWSRAYQGEHLSAPLLVDVGTAKGGFIKALASDCAEDCTTAKSGVVYNLLGVEIFDILVDAANAWVKENASTLKRRAHFIGCNANVSLTALNMPNVRAICIQFPDPWSNKPNRRVVTPKFVDDLAAILPSGGEIYCCSDVRALAEEMYDVVSQNEHFVLDERTYERVGEMPEKPDLEPVPEFDAAHQYKWIKNTHLRDDDKDDKGEDKDVPRRWLNANPYAAYTERDIVCESKWRPVYRCAMIRI